MSNTGFFYGERATEHEWEGECVLCGREHTLFALLDPGEEVEWECPFTDCGAYNYSTPPTTEPDPDEYR